MAEAGGGPMPLMQQQWVGDNIVGLGSYCLYGRWLLNGGPPRMDGGGKENLQHAARMVCSTGSMTGATCSPQML